MLTIARKPNEFIIIQTPDGDEIRITVNKFQSDQVKVSIDAPRDYIINREELMTDDVV